MADSIGIVQSPGGGPAAVDLRLGSGFGWLLWPVVLPEVSALVLPFAVIGVAIG